jgi:hypothetical protein
LNHGVELLNERTDKEASMKKKWKWISGSAVVLLAAVLLFQFVYPTTGAHGQTDDSATQRTVSVLGTGQVQGEPDAAVVTLGVETEAEEASAALTQNNQQMQALVEALGEAGLSGEELQTQTIRLSPRYEREPEGAQELVGYRAINLLEARIRDLDELGTVLDAAVEAGGNRVEGIRFEITDTSALLDRAREAAWEDARHKAEQLAHLAFTDLGPASTIQETSRSVRPVERVALEQPQAAVPVEPGTQTISVDLQVTWLLH